MNYSYAEMMELLFGKQERELEAMRIVAWIMEFRWRVANLEEVQP